MRYLIRAHQSGVWLDVEILGDGPLPGMVQIRGRRAHAWRGAIDCSDLAQQGPGAGSRITREVVTSLRPDDVVEVLPMSDQALARVRDLPPAEVS